MTNNASISLFNAGISKSGDSGFLQYLKEIQKFPILTPEQEYEFGMKYKNTGDKEAAKALLQSHLRLVVKMAGKFKNYGLPVVDLVSEGNLGLIQAVKKFDPKKGFRFSTYAMWWIRAYIQEYILRSWSLVKIGTTVAQKKLFFNLHKIRKKISDTATSNRLAPEHINQIAEELNVSKQEVIDMDSRLQQSDSSLNLVIGDEEDGIEVGNTLSDNQDNQEEIAIKNQEKSRQYSIFKEAIKALKSREKDILIKRQMVENPMTLEELSQFYKISRERVRQIETSAIDKIKKEVKRMQLEMRLN